MLSEQAFNLAPQIGSPALRFTVSRHMKEGDIYNNRQQAMSSFKIAASRDIYGFPPHIQFSEHH
jgi:hypothetical protein